jgi:flagellin-like protein
MKVRHSGVSEVLGSLMMLVITLVLAVMMAAFVRSDAGVSANQLVNANQSNIDYLNEKFDVPLIHFPATNEMQIFIQNSGVIALQIQTIEVHTTSLSTLNVLYNSAGSINENSLTCTGTVAATESPALGTAPSDFLLKEGGIATITLTLPSCVSYSFATGTTYCIVAIGRYNEAVSACVVDEGV